MPTNNLIVPYSLLDSVDWSISNLYYSQIKQSRVSGISIGGIALINKQKFKRDTESSTQQYRYVDISALDIETGMISNAAVISLENMPDRAKTIAQQGDVLVSLTRPERGAVAIVPSELDGCVVSNAIAVLTPHTVASEWLYFVLRNPTVCRELAYQAKSAAIPTITLKQLEKYVLPITSVSPTNAALAKRLYADWKKVFDEYQPLSVITEESFKKQIIKHCEIESNTNPYVVIPYEKLERRWDIGNYLDLFQRFPEWNVPVKKLEDFSKFQAVVPNHDRCNEYGRIMRIKLQNFTENELYIQPETLELEEFCIDKRVSDKNNFLKTGDIIIPRVGGKSAKTMVLPESLQGIDIMKQIIVLRADRRIVSPEYLALYFKTSWADAQVKACTVGIGQPFIQQASLRRISVPIPSLEIQMQIVNEIKQRDQRKRFIERKETVNKFIEDIIKPEEK